MKKVFVLITATLFCCVLSIAQAPNSLPYQGVARTASGGLVSSKNISLRFSIHDAIPSGTIQFQETHNITTSAQGLFSVNIGQGTATIFNLDSVTWSSGGKFLQVEMDVNGGSSFIDMGTTQFGSVPYALYAGKGNIPNGKIVGSTLRWNGSAWIADTSITNNGSSVGINTANPQDVLHVKTSNSSIRFGSWAANSQYNILGLNGSNNLTDYNFATSGTVDKSLYINRPTNFDVSFREGGITQMLLARGGNVGIGTGVPATKLHVVGATTIQDSLVVGSDFAGGGRIVIANNNNTFSNPIGTRLFMHSGVQYSAMGGGTFPLYSTVDIDCGDIDYNFTPVDTFIDGATMHLREPGFRGVVNNRWALLTHGSIKVNGSQNVSNDFSVGGAFKLTSSNFGNGKILTSDSFGVASWKERADNSNWSVNGNDISNKNSGNVGIGTTTPTEKLDVAGNIKATGTINALKPVMNGITSTTVEAKHNNAIIYENHSLVLDGSLPTGFSCDIIYYSNFAGTITSTASIMYQQGSLTPVNSIAINQGAHIRVMVMDATHYFVTVMQ